MIRLSSALSALSLLALLGQLACGGQEAPPAGVGTFATPPSSAAKGGGSSGPAQIPPSATVDGPAWFLYSPDSATSPNINFIALPNTVQGAISIGATRTAQLIVYNVSKKTALTITSISVVGANPGDFTVDAATAKAALATAVPANKGQGALLNLTFSPLAEGPRSATLLLVSNAGTASVSLTGAGLPPRPILTIDASFNFLPASAFSTAIVSNSGGQALVLQSISIAGNTPGAFQFTAANHGAGNCFAGVPLAPHSFCYIGIGLSATAVAPASGDLIIDSNDPNAPVTDIPLTLTP